MRLLLAGFLFTAVAFAQGMGGGGMGEGGGMGGGRNGGGMSVPNIGPSRPSRLELMSEILKLNKDQRKEVKSIMDEGQKQALPLQAELKKNREQIAEAVASGKNQDEIGPALKTYAETEARMARVELEAFVKIYKLLDGEQRPRGSGVFQMMGGIFSGKNWNES
jgi:Spy/CpxP family protein refolding chaperone